MPARLLSLSLLAVALSACTSAATPLPPEVQTVIDENCATCHADAPRFGAPMPLTTWEAMHAPARTQPELSVFQLVGMRIHDEDDPMPARGMLPARELAVLDGWIAAGAPPGSGMHVVVPPVEVGPEFLPCEVAHEFRAHAAGSESAPFELAAGGNSTMCFAFASPFGDATQGTAFAPIIDDDRVVHHWIIFGSSTLPAGVEVGDVFECAAGGLTAGSQFLSGWAPGGQNSVLPDDQGRSLPDAAGYVILQVHYWNVAGYTDVADRTGVGLCTTDTPRTHELATATLGSLNISIDPRARGHEVVGTCTPDITQPVTIVGSGPHMHTRGVSLRTEVVRAGTGTVEMLVDVPHWDFNSQTSYAPPAGGLVVMPGDMLRTTCVYDNPTDTRITFGERTEDEMCFNFVSAYPPGALATAGGRSRGLCID